VKSGPGERGFPLTGDRLCWVVGAWSLHLKLNTCWVIAQLCPIVSAEFLHDPRSPRLGRPLDAAPGTQTMVQAVISRPDASDCSKKSAGMMWPSSRMVLMPHVLPPARTAGQCRRTSVQEDMGRDPRRDITIGTR